MNLNKEKYNLNNNGFPNEFIPEDKKDSHWYLAWAKAMLSEYVNGKCFTSPEMQAEFDMLRRYGNGEQDEDIAMCRVFKNYSEKKKDAEIHNIDPTILPIMPKFKHTILGMFNDVEFTVLASATDKFTATEKEKMKWQKYADIVLERTISFVDKATGVKKAPDNSWKPRDLGELNLYEQMGGFRVPAEIGAEKIVSHGLDKDSRWAEIKDKLIEDAVDWGMMAVIDLTDPREQKAYSQYANPRNIVCKYTRENDFDSQKYGGYLASVSIDDLRRTGEFSEDQLAKIAQQAYEQIEGSKNDLETYMRFDERLMSWGYDHFKVDVFKAWFKAYESETRKRKTSSKGRVIWDEPAKWGEKGSNNVKVYRNDYERVYKLTYIIGLDIVYDTGLESDVIHEPGGQPRMPLQVVKIPGPSITKRCVPNLNNMQVAWIKFQNSLTKSRPPGLAIEHGAISNLAIKGQKISGSDIIRVATQEGSIIYSATTVSGKYNMSAKPVYELAGGMGNQLNEFITVFDLNRGFIQETTGITPESSGGQVAERQSATLTELMYANTSNNLKPIIDRYHNLKLRAAENLFYRAQNILRFSKKGREYYAAVIGQIYIDSLTIPNSKEFRGMGISLIIKPDQSMKDRVLAAAIEAMKAGKNGQPGITHSDYMLIEQIVTFGNLKEAQKRLDMIISEAVKKDQKYRQQVQAQQEQHQLALAQEKTKAEEVKHKAALEKIKAEEAKEIAVKSALLDKEILLERIKRGLDAKTPTQS